jgi:hypothetical protein
VGGDNIAVFPRKNSGAELELPWCPNPIADEVLGLIFTDVEGETGLKADLSTAEEGLAEFSVSTRASSSFKPSLPTAALYDARYCCNALLPCKLTLPLATL